MRRWSSKSPPPHQEFAPVAQRMSAPLRTERHAGSTPVWSSDINRVKLVQKSPAPGTRRTVGGTPHPDHIKRKGEHRDRIQGLRRPRREYETADRRCMSVGSVAGGVLCADGHLGYAQPVGGVIAYEEHVSISGVGFDIGCGNMAARVNLKYEDIRE